MFSLLVRVSDRHFRRSLAELAIFVIARKLMEFEFLMQLGGLNLSLIWTRLMSALEEKTPAS